ncbi:uncharacterized protein ARMOST_10371 [Armillaria ostoyae]|uniref:Uncharacterized protein n=1 Tax=Armillaria ostoyae TaxID=47428 RepID=A0A284RE75_ARMOS|nr:uncharacterized protein ARMOST_10371 [Armillaria ostoyae]
MVKGILESLDKDKETNSGDDDDNDGETKKPEMPENFRFIHAYMYITTFLFPRFKSHVSQLEDLASDDPLKAIFKILAAINAGSRSGCSDDTTKISDNIIRLSTKDLTEETLLPTLKKYQRRFNHIHMAHLLCPQRWLDEFDKDPACTKLTTRYLPSYLYDPDLIDFTNPRKGLLWGHTCIRSFHAIYLGNAEHNTSELYNTVKEKLNLKAASEEMIVYAAVQARFALSSCTMWGDQSNGFDLKQYNKKLTTIFMDSLNEDGDTWARDIVEFYTSEILKPKTDEDQEQIDNDDDESIMNRNHETRIKERAAAAAADQQLDDENGTP